MYVKFWGTRGSIPAPGPSTVRYGGNTSCLEVRTSSGDLMILDAGSGIRALGLDLAAHMPLSCSIFITHTHWDHIHGLPFFTPLFVPGNTIHIYGTPDPVSLKTIRDALAMQMEHRYFPVMESELKSRIEYHTLSEGETVSLDTARVTTAIMNHTVLCYGYRVEADGAVLFYTGDHEPFDNIYAPGEDGYEEYGMALDEKKDRILQAMRGADALVVDAQYTEEEYRSKRGWGHATFETAVELALEAEVKAVYLVHHDPTRTDEQLDVILEQVRARFQGAPIDIHMAMEGRELSL